MRVNYNQACGGFLYRRKSYRVGRLLSRPNTISNAIGYAKYYSRSEDAVIRVYDDGGGVIETHNHAGDFKEP